MSAKEQFLSKRERYQPISLPQEFSDEEMARDWTLSEEDREEIGKHRKSSRLFIAIQLCAVRLYGRFLNGLHDLSPRIVNYLNRQLDLPPAIARPHKQFEQGAPDDSRFFRHHGYRPLSDSRTADCWERACA